MEWLLLILVVLVLVTLVGHGLWVFVAWIFRGGTRRPDDAAPPTYMPPARLCPTCRALIPPYMPACPTCAARPNLTVDAAWDVAAERVRHLHQSGALPADAVNQVLAAIERQRAAERPAPVAALPVEAGSIGPVTPPPLPRQVQEAPVAEEPAPITPLPAPPPPPRRPWSEVLAGFMEQRNIRWGELVGGLLIVGCSVALVLSFWAQIAQRPVLKFSVFTAVTGGLFALGLYTEHRWKLPTTSRGMLLIATLLVPLNFLAFAALSQPTPGGGVGPTGDVVAVVGEVVALGLFLWLLHAAAKVIAPQWPWVLTAGVLGLSVASLAVRYATPLGARAMPPAVVMGLGVAAVACYVGANWGMLARARRWDAVDAEGAGAVLLFLGVLSFAAVFPLALLAYKSGDPAGALGRLAPLIGLAGLPAVAGGLMLWRRVGAGAGGIFSEDAGDAGVALTGPADDANDAAGFRTAGAAVAVLGVMVMAAGVPLAWPRPGEMLAAAGVDAAAIAALAFAFRVPAGHLLAAGCALLACLLGYHLLAGHVGWATDGHALLPALLLPGGGTALGGLVLLMLAMAEGLARLRRPADARAYVAAAAAAAGVSLALAAGGGIGTAGDPHHLAWLCGGYAAAAFAVGLRGRSAAGGWAGWGLLLAGVGQWLAARAAGPEAWATGLLAYATAATAATLGASGRADDWRRRVVAGPARAAAVVASAAAVLTIVTGAGEQLTTALAVRAGWLAGLWLAIAAAEASAGWFAAGQAAAAGAVVLFALSRVAGRAWFAGAAHPLLDPWTWQAMAGGLALLGIGWEVARLLVGRVVLARRNAVVPGEFPSGGGTVPTADLGRVRTADHSPENGPPDGGPQCGPYENPSEDAQSDLLPAPQPRGAEVRPRWFDAASVLLRPAWTVDRITTTILVVALLAMGLLAVAPGVAAELAARGGEATDLVAPAAHGHAAGAGSWLLLGLLLAIAACQHRQGFRSAAAHAALLVAWAACPLLAARAGGAGASALRWAAAAYLLAGTGVLAALRAMARSAGEPQVRPGDPSAPSDPSPVARAARQLLLALGVGPVVLLSLVPLAAALTGEPRAGPAAGSVFARVGPAVSYGVPLLLVATVFVAGAVPARSVGQALAALVMVDLAVTTVYVLTTTAATPLGARQFVRLAQMDAAATAAFALAWLGALAVAGRRAGRRPMAPPAAVGGSIAAALAAVALVAVPGMGQMLLDPVRAGGVAAEAGGVWGWVALALSAAAAAAGVAATGRDRLSLPAVGVMLPAAAAMTGFAALEWERGDWVAFHTWMAAQTAAAWAVLGLGWWLHRTGRGVVLRPGADAANDRPTLGNPPGGAGNGVPLPVPVALDYERPEAADEPTEVPVAPTTVYVGGRDVRRAAAGWAGALGAVVVLLALRAMFGDPAAPWWSVGTVFVVGLLTTAVAAWLSAPGYLYGSALLLNLAATLFAVRSPWQTGTHPLLTLLQINVIALALPAAAWLVLERQVFARSREAARVRGGWPPVHRVAAVLAAVAVAVVPVFGLAADFGGHVLRVSPVLTWAAFGSAAALMAACLWDRGARFAAAGLYALGIVGLATLVDAMNLPPVRIVWAGAMLLAGFGLLAGGAWRVTARAARATTAVAGAGPAPAARVPGWLVDANQAIALAVLAVAFWTDFAFPGRTDRVLMAAAAVAQVASIGLLARGGWDSGLQRRALLVGMVAAVALGWAFQTPMAFAPAARYVLSYRGVIAATVLNVVALAYGVGLRRLAASAGIVPDDAVRPAGQTHGAAESGPGRGTGWVDAGQWAAVPAAVAALVLMLGTLAVEATQYPQMKLVRMHPAAIGVMIAAFFAWCGVVLYWALVPRRDPLQLSERGRMGYVYAAEALAALGYLHIKLTCPPILPPLFNRFWPIILMGVAFAGVGLGEVFRRRGRRVLYEPFERTGAFLPLLLVGAFWFAPSGAHYSGVLLAAGAVYAVAAVLRRSFGFGLLAALAGNGALWYLLHHTERFGFLAHPQLWVIPAALSVLAAGEMNKATLAAGQLRALRYGCLVAVYVSSTADIVIHGAAESPWLPLVLAALSVAGVFAGVGLRVRSFLFLGTGFLALAVVAMIRNAAVNLHWTWLWYVAGIVLGLGIIALFALFEKKRAEMLALVEGLRAWQ